MNKINKNIKIIISPTASPAAPTPTSVALEGGDGI
jgi:hypothetical protein